MIDNIMAALNFPLRNKFLKYAISKKHFEEDISKLAVPFRSSVANFVSSTECQQRVNKHNIP